jgi:TonB family protein
MYFEFEDDRPDTPRIDAPISKREGVLLSIIFHALFVIGLLLLPPIGREAQLDAIRRAEELALARQQATQEEDRQRFVFVQPRVDVQAPRAPERAELSDVDRVARAPERADEPTNPLPFARGDSAERVIAEAPPEPERVPERPSDVAEQGEAPESAVAAGERGDGTPQLEQQLASILPEGRSGLALPSGRPLATPGGALGDALRNLQRYVDRESFDNPQGGGGGVESWIDFDTKGVEFGPWIRRFVAQVKRNWIVPMAVLAMHGRVVMTFNVHKDGRLTDIRVERPSSVEGFNVAAANALRGSNPTYPLPPEYPTDYAFFTVTFFYNESPAE